MRNTILAIKRLVSEMESYVYCDNYDRVNQLANELLDMTNMIKKQCTNSNGFHDYMDTVEEYPGFMYISTLPFLYKPILVKNYYDGDYLEIFNQKRTDELKRAKVLELHNRFWTSNNVEGGNVFGSIPLELISKESADILYSCGWEKVDVSIYEIEAEMNFKELDRFCSSNFRHYIIAMEMKNKTKLVLNYNITDKYTV